MKKIKVWKCEGCGTLFTDEEECKDCEKWHLLEDKLEITEMGGRLPEARFPSIILVAFKDFSGVAAEYHKCSEGSIEDFYEEADWKGNGYTEV